MVSVVSIYTNRAPTIFTHKALAIWETLEQRFSAQLSSAEIDHLFARFVFGLTSPIHGEDEPLIHLDICRKVLALKLTPERIDRALRLVPTASVPWVESAYESIEALGAKAGRELLDQQRNQYTDAGPEAETRPLRLTRAESGRIA